MNWNRIRKNIRRGTEGVSDRILGVMKPSKSLHVKILGKATLFESLRSYEQAQNSSWEFELKKSRAIEFVRRFQNRYL